MNSPLESVRRPLLCFLCFLCLPFSSTQPQSQGEVVRFAVIGDSGTGDKHQYRVAEQMVAWHDRLPYELVLMLGDNIYSGLFGSGGGDEKDFAKKFDRPYADLLGRGVVFRAALGNHDVRHRDGRDEIESYDRFHIDGPQGYYSFTAGEWLPPERQEPAPLVEFFVLNTTRLEKGKRDPEQLAWLGRALAASRARWRIVYGHHPPYSTGRRHASDVSLRQKLEPLLLGPHASSPSSPVAPATGSGARRLPEAGASGLGIEREGSPRVQVVLAGHDHFYQRFHPRQGVIYFVCGSSGKLRRGNARVSSLVAAVEDRQRVFMLWEATAAELRFRALNEQGEAFDCGILRSAGAPESVACSVMSRESERDGR